MTEPGPGDVVMWRVGRTFSHGGIVVKWPIVVHAYARARRVIESDVSLPGIFTSEKHPRRFFSYWAGQSEPPDLREPNGLLRRDASRNDGSILPRHCEERSDAAIHSRAGGSS